MRGSRISVASPPFGGGAFSSFTSPPSAVPAFAWPFSLAGTGDAPAPFKRSDSRTRRGLGGSRDFGAAFGKQHSPPTPSTAATTGTAATVSSGASGDGGDHETHAEKWGVDVAMKKHGVSDEALVL